VTAASPGAILPRRAGDPGPHVDLLASWRSGGFLMEREGAGIVAGGELRRIEVPAGLGQAARAASLADAALADLHVDGAVIAAALPFAGDTPAHLLVPERVRITSIAPRELDLAARDGRRAAGGGGGRGEDVVSPSVPSRTAVPATAGAGAHPAPHLTSARSGPMRWRAHPPLAAYAEAVAEAISRIRDGRLEKVVLARSLVASNPGIEVRALLAELRRRDPGCHLFAAPAFASAEGGDFVGATPETLIRREGDRVLSLPHAGTAARSPDPARDRQAAEALLRSAKNRHEHAAVVEAVADSLQPHCAQLRVDPEPHLAATATVWHLVTAVRGRLRPSAPGALSLAAALHPTPAVCGTPTAAAAELIAELEPGPRGLYAGLVGWVDSRGDGEWAVSLRCALVTRAEVRIHAGAGIVAESQPELEVAETEVKFRTLIDALEACPPAAGGAPA
jgi:isochorismate synthase